MLKWKYLAGIALFVVAGLAVWLTGCGNNTTGSNLTTPAEEQTSAGNPEVTDTSSGSRMIGSNNQMAVRNECWYALDSAWINKPNDSTGPSGINGGCSRWHYISTDGNNNALRYVLTSYRDAVTNLIHSTNGTLDGKTIEYWVGRLSNDDYSINFPNCKGVGHGCQCVSFVNMIIYRARQGYRLTDHGITFWNGGKMPNDGSAKTAKVGDIVYYYVNSGNAHVAICVIASDGGGITVVDSNWVGGKGNEVIGRHYVPNSTLDASGGWKKISGAGRWY